MSKEHAQALQIQAAGKPVELQSGEFVANAEFHRDGADLFLTSPSGETVVIKDYFAQNPPPDINTADGAHLSPEMVEAFLPPQHPGEYAANTTTANDASPAGKITEVVGDAVIVRADGTHVPAEVGTPVYPGDVVQTQGDGAVSLQFIDNSTFALSENARLSIDEYIFNTADQSGSTLFSMMQGVFVYTSGLIGKHDPGSVNIDTPVGSIGIRGTVVAGDINPSGQDSQITIVDGAIVLTNAGGSTELNDSFETAVLSSYQTQPDNIGQISAQSFTQSYDAVSTVAPTTFDAVGSGAAVPSGTTPHEATPTAPVESQPAPSGPATEAAPQPDGSVTATTDATAATATPPATTDAAVTDPSLTTTTDAVTATTTTTFTSTTTTFGTTDAFLPPPPPPGGTATFLPPPPPPPTGTTTTTTTATTTLPPPPHVQFAFSNYYLHGTPGDTSDDGITPFATTWDGVSPLVIGHLSLLNFTAAPYIDFSGSFGGPSLQYSSPTGLLANTTVANPNVFSFDTATGNLVLNDRFAVLGNGATSGSFNFSVKAYDYLGGHLIDQYNFTVFVRPDGLPATIDNVFIGDRSSANTAPNVTTVSNDTLVGTSMNDVIWGREGDDTLATGSGGADTLVGGGGNDTFYLSTTDLTNVVLVDGGKNTLLNPFNLGDRMQLTGTGTFDFTTLSNAKFKGIETIEMMSSGSVLNLNIQDVFDMTDPGANKELRIQMGTAGNAMLNITGLTAEGATLVTGTDPVTGANYNTTAPTGNINDSGLLKYYIANYHGTGSSLTLVVDQLGSTDGIKVTAS